VTPLENIDRRLTTERIAWLAAIHREDRESEAACMALLNELLTQRWEFMQPGRGVAWGNYSTL